MAISTTTLLSFLLTCIVIEITPGPNMAYLAIVAATHGRRTGWMATLGIACGLLMLGLAAAFGLATLVLKYSILYETLRWCGVAYLLWLAWEGWTEAEGSAPEDATHPIDNATYFWRGLVTNLLNPKAALFFLSVLPDFVDLSRSILPQTVGLSIVYVLVATTIHATIVALAGTASNLLARPDDMRMLRRTLSALLAIIALWLAYATAR